MERKRLWVRWVRREFGDCGKLIYVDYKGLGFAEFAPARFLPNAVRYQSGPPSDDAVLIYSLFILEKIYQHQGLGSLMVKSIISEARAGNIKALETFARKGRADDPSGLVEFWQKHGFAILRDIDEFPLLRLQV